MITEIQKITDTNKKAMFESVRKFSGLATKLNKMSKTQGAAASRFEQAFLEIVGKTSGSSDLENVERQLTSLINNNKKALGGNNFGP